MTATDQASDHTSGQSSGRSSGHKLTRWAARPVLALAGLILLSGCGGSHRLPATTNPATITGDRWPTSNGGLSSHRSGCDVLDGVPLPGGEFTIALTQSVRPANAPVPRNGAERVVFAQLYETLVNVACDGALTAGLATAWTCTDDSTTWVFTIRESARFWDGTHVTAADIKQAWTRNQQQHTGPAEASPWQWLQANDRTIVAVDDTHLAVHLPEPQPHFPWLLAHPAAAVAVLRTGWTWPVGSGPARLRASDPAPRPDLVCRPNTHHPDHPAWKTLSFKIVPAADLRDQLSATFDLATTANLDVVDFFAEVPGFRTLPLPWSRLYLLICPPATNPAGIARWADAASDIAVSRDLGSVSARPWDHLTLPVRGDGDCPQLRGPITGGPALPFQWRPGQEHRDAEAIAYLGLDPGAAAIAARLSHLAGPGTHVVASSLAELDRALAQQLTGACVIGMDQIFPTGCLQWAALLGRVAWLQQAGIDAPAEVALPVALSRRWLIVRGDLAGLRLAYDGTPLLAQLGRAEASPVMP